MVLFFLIQITLIACLMVLFLMVYAVINIYQLDFLPTLLITIIFTYLLSLVVLLIVYKGSQSLMKEKEGEIDGSGIILWTIQVTAFDILINITRKLFIHTPVPDLLYRMFGLKQGKKTTILTHRIWDPDLIEIGANSLIGTNVLLSGHHIRRGKLYRKRIIIGKNVTIGADTVITPGVTIGDNTIVTIGSTIPPNWTLDSDCLYGGVPVKKLKDYSNRMVNKT